MRPFGAQRFDHRQQVRERAGEAVDARDNERVAAATRVRAAASWGRARLAPEANSSNTSAQPAARRASSCGPRFWSSVETRA